MTVGHLIKYFWFIQKRKKKKRELIWNLCAFLLIHLFGIFHSISRIASQGILFESISISLKISLIEINPNRSHKHLHASSDGFFRLIHMPWVPLLGFIILRTRFVVSIKVYMVLTKLLELGLTNSAPLCLALATLSTHMTQPYFCVTQTV